MWYVLILVPWTDMCRWLDFLEDYCPSWDFCYSATSISTNTNKDSFAPYLRKCAIGIFDNIGTPAHMQIKLDDKDMMLLKLSWEDVQATKDLEEFNHMIHG